MQYTPQVSIIQANASVKTTLNLREIKVHYFSFMPINLNYFLMDNYENHASTINQNIQQYSSFDVEPSSASFYLLPQAHEIVVRELVLLRNFRIVPCISNPSSLHSNMLVFICAPNHKLESTGMLMSISLVLSRTTRWILA